MNRPISRRRSKRRRNTTQHESTQPAPKALAPQPVASGDPETVFSQENLERMQRTYGNTATRLLVQRELESGSHGKGCGCSLCGGGRVQRSVDQFMRQADGPQDAAHGKGCGCDACGGKVQRIQRELMSYKAFKASTKGKGRRNKVKPIDEALKAYNKAADSLSDEQKIQQLQTIVQLCQTYLDDPKRSSSKRSDGVQALQTLANQHIKQLQPAVVEQVAEQPNPIALQTPPTPLTPPPLLSEVMVPTSSIKETTAKVEPEKAPDPATTAKSYYAQILTGNDPSTDPSLDRSDMLDLLQKHLTKQEFAKAAANLMLLVPGSVVESAEAKERALEILELQLINKEVARRLIDRQTYVIIIPRNKRMTDVDEFRGLAGTKTFDGRNWEDVRGAGGFEHNGKVYVAVSEENTTGAQAEDAAARTNWCYAPGYSTTVHEMAHAVQIYGLSKEDNTKYEEAYNAKKKLESEGTPQEWIDGYNAPVNIDLSVGKNAAPAVKTKLEVDMTTESWGEPAQKYLLGKVTKTLTEGAKLDLDNTYQSWLVHWGILANDKKAINDATGTAVYELDGDLMPKRGTTKHDTKQCYASSHVREYWAQGATAWFGANVGKDPYTQAEWAAAGDPKKADRRNGKAEVKRIDPVLGEIMERVFADTTIDDLNKPRAKKGGSK